MIDKEIELFFLIRSSKSFHPSADGRNFFAMKKKGKRNNLYRPFGFVIGIIIGKHVGAKDYHVAKNGSDKTQGLKIHFFKHSPCRRHCAAWQSTVNEQKC